MSPRAAWRLETLAFEHVFDYVAGKVDWLAHGLPREGEETDVPYAGDLLDREVGTCELHDDLAAMTTALAATRYGFCLVVTGDGIVLGRLRKSALDQASPDATAEDLMEPAPSTVRANPRARPSRPAQEARPQNRDRHHPRRAPCWASSQAKPPSASWATSKPHAPS